jgi:hypothetical protein
LAKQIAVVMIKKLLIILLICLPCFINSQDTLKQYKNSIGVEILGETGGLLNLTYSRDLFSVSPTWKTDICFTVIPKIIMGMALNIGATRTINKHSLRFSIGGGTGIASFYLSYYKPKDIVSSISGSEDEVPFIYFTSLFSGVKYKYKLSKRTNIFIGNTAYYFPLLRKRYGGHSLPITLTGGIGVEYKF